MYRSLSRANFDLDELIFCPCLFRFSVFNLKWICIFVSTDSICFHIFAVLLLQCFVLQRIDKSFQYKDTHFYLLLWILYSKVYFKFVYLFIYCTNHIRLEEMKRRENGKEKIWAMKKSIRNKFAFGFEAIFFFSFLTMKCLGSFSVNCMVQLLWAQNVRVRSACWLP